MNKKIILLISLIFVFSSFISATIYKDEVTYYWNFSSATTFIDEVSGATLTKSGTLGTTTGHLGTAINGFGNGEYLKSFNMYTTNNDQEYCLFGWVYPATYSSSNFHIVWSSHGQSADPWINDIYTPYWAGISTTNTILRRDADTNDQATATEFSRYENQWVFMAISVDWTNGNFTKCFNNNCNSNSISGTGRTPQQAWCFGNDCGRSNQGYDRPFSGGAIDDFGYIANRSCSISEFIEIYNSGSGLIYSDFPLSSQPPIINIVNPTENYHSNNPLEFHYNVTDVDLDLLNCSVYIDNILNYTTLNINTSLNPNQYNNITFDDGEYNIKVNCTDGIYSISENRTFVIDNVFPVITLNTIENDNSSRFNIYNTNNILFNDTFEDTYLFAYNVTSFYPNGSILFQNITTGLTTDYELFDYNLSLNLLPSGNYSIKYIVSDDHTISVIENYDYTINPDGFYFNFDDYYINIASDNPNTLNSLSTSKLIDRYTFNIDFKTPQNTRYFSLKSDEKIYYRGNLYSYPSFVVGKNWVDFNIDSDGVSYKVIEKSNNWYQIEITTDSPLDVLNIKSIGGLNTIEESYSYELFYNSPPNITFISQYPTDFNISNVLSFINLTYNSTDNEDNVENLDITYFVNNSYNDNWIFINGVSYNEPIIQNYNNNILDTYYFQIFSNKYLPSSYNYNESLMENTLHSNGQMNNNNIIKVRFYNLTNDTDINYIEFMMNRSLGPVLHVYYCNENYIDGNPDINSNCVDFVDLEPNGYDHTHSIYSSHQVIPFNIVNNQISGVDFTETSYFLFTGSGWNYYYLNVDTDSFAISSNNGLTYTEPSFTLDAHIHQFYNDTTFNYYSCGTDGEFKTCSNNISDSFEFGELTPVAPIFLSPVYGNYSQFNFNITIEPQTQPPSINISYYNYSFLNSDFTFNSSINDNTTQTSIIDSYDLNGYFYIKVVLCATNGICISQNSDLFGIGDLTTPTTTTTTDINLTQLEQNTDDIKEGIKMFGLLFIYAIFLIIGILFNRWSLVFVASIFGSMIFLKSDYEEIIKLFGIIINVALLYLSITKIKDK